MSRLALETAIWPVFLLQLGELSAARWDEAVVTAEGRRTTPQVNSYHQQLGTVAPNATAGSYG